MAFRPCLLLASSFLLLDLVRSRPFPSNSFASSDPTSGQILSNAKRGDEHTPNPLFWQCPAPYSSVLRPIDGGRRVAAEVKFNGVPRELLVDTGSSDTWMFARDVKCADLKGNDVPAAECRFGDTYSGDRFERIAGQHFTSGYGSNESLTGPYGYVDASVAGITVPHQEVSLIERAAWGGDNLKSGVLGLASRLTTAQLPGEKRYSPLFESMYNKTHQIAPVYSLAVQRGAKGGYLAFGGLPPVDFDHDFASANFTGVNFHGQSPRRRFYPIKPENYELNGETHETTYTAVVDSGTYALRLPAPVADDMNAAFDPPARFDAALNLYTTACNATVPELSIGIGGKQFPMQPEDLFPFVREGDICATTIFRELPTGNNGAYPDGFFILGSNFLRNVVAVFDVQNEQLHVAKHSVY